MKLTDVDLNLFLVFELIYRKRSLTKAADALGITQPAASNALNRLRSFFDDQLFLRRSGHMVPTPFAQNIIEPVRESLTKLETGLSEYDRFDPIESKRQFVFAMSDMAEFYLFPFLMEYLQSHAPNMDLQSRTVHRSQLASEFEAGRLDFALDVPWAGGKDMEVQDLIDDRFVCVARNGHPTIQGEISLEQYLDAKHIHIAYRQGQLGFVDMHLNHLGLRRNIALRMQHSTTAPATVARTDMLLTIPETLAKEQDLQVLELPFELPTLGWSLYWPSSYNKDKAHTWMREAIMHIVGIWKVVRLDRQLQQKQSR